jgi:hypothetical protein
MFLPTITVIKSFPFKTSSCPAAKTALSPIPATGFIFTLSWVPVLLT